MGFSYIAIPKSNEGYKNSHWNKDKANDNTTPDGVSLFNSIHSIYDVGDNIKEKKSKVWKNI